MKVYEPDTDLPSAGPHDGTAMNIGAIYITAGTDCNTFENDANPPLEQPISVPAGMSARDAWNHYQRQQLRIQ